MQKYVNSYCFAALGKKLFRVAKAVCFLQYSAGVSPRERLFPLVTPPRVSFPSSPRCVFLSPRLPHERFFPLVSPLRVSSPLVTPHKRFLFSSPRTSEAKMRGPASLISQQKRPREIKLSGISVFLYISIANKRLNCQNN